MSRGLGWVQAACLYVVKRDEGKRGVATYAIAAYVYQVKPDKNGDRLISDAQHVAVKRALEGLQRKGMVIGFRDTYYHARDRGRADIELCHVWMTEAGFARWLAGIHAHGFDDTAEADAIAKRARAIGMKV